MKNEITLDKSVGIVQTQYYTFAEPPDEMVLVSGKKLGPITLAYETYGILNQDKSNAILILHALSGSAHAAGYHTEADAYPGWWENYIGPGKAFDTNKYFVICSNVIGGCSGSTGPSSINPATGKEYALNFPIVTIQDMVNAQRHLIDYLGIEKLLAVAGGSMGGMQALQWSISYHDRVQSVIAIATAASLSAQGIAFHEVGRQAIMRDPNWNNGNYYHATSPSNGLSLARMIGHITYLSEKLMHEKFGRRLQQADIFKFQFDLEFEVESYLHHKGNDFVQRFDANSYLYITKAIDYFDLKNDFGGDLANAFVHVNSDYLIISFSSDWLYPTSQSREIVRALRMNSKNVVFTEIQSDKGHDTFLLPNEQLEHNIANFLKREFEKVHKK
ncbi:MAG: homoserine O-acetyltransferase [Spirochaetota bacterium]